MNDLSRDAQADADLSALIRAAKSGHFILGPQVSAFEKEFAAYLGVEHCVGVASGTDALRLAMRGVGVSPGETVVMAANAGMYAAAAAVDIGASPDWVEVDPATATLSPDALASRLSRGGVNAVVVTHLYGNMADVEALTRVCALHRVPLIEDCAQATGARAHGLSAGTWGDCAAFSFYPTKNLGAWGDAGAVVTRRSDVVERVKSLRQYGWSRKYVADAPFGCNSRMDELQAAVLRSRLSRVDGWNERRRTICRAYRTALPARARLLFRDDDSSVGHLAVIVLPDEESRRGSIDWLGARGVATDIHYPIPDHRQAALRDLVSPMLALPITDDLTARIVTVPCFPDLTDDEIDTVVSALTQLPT